MRKFASGTLRSRSSTPRWWLGCSTSIDSTM